MSADPFEESGAYPERVAVVDLGSNSVKMVCYSADHTGAYRPYHRESARVRLDEYGKGVVGKEPAARLMEVLTIFRNITAYERVGRVLAVATSAVRSARNRQSLLSEIREEIGFDFSVLSGEEEALYSYAGAASRLSMPSSVFFDLGGGSLEIVSARNHAVTRAVSLPLGALVMTRRFAGDGDLGEESLGRLRAHVHGSLPAPEMLGPMGRDAVLVGVGGTLRAIAKYVQGHTGYPLKKLHNYTMDAHSIMDAAAEIISTDTADLSRMYEIGNGRADIIKAGAVIVAGILDKFNFGGITVSAAGLREGVLAVASRYPDFGRHQVSEYHVRELVRAPPGTPHVPAAAAGVVRPLGSSGLLSGEEPAILQAAAANLEMLRTFRDADDFLYRVMDKPSPLPHRIQLLAALCLAYSKKPKRSRLLMDRYRSILYRTDDQILRRLSPVLYLCDLVITAGAVSNLSVVDGSLTLAVGNEGRTIPATILQQACRRVGGALGADMAVKAVRDRALIRG